MRKQIGFVTVAACLLLWHHAHLSLMYVEEPPVVVTPLTRNATHNAPATTTSSIRNATRVDEVTGGPKLIAALLIRIWPQDAFGMTPLHLRHWIAHLAFAGVSELRVYAHEGELPSHEEEGLALRVLPWHVSHYADAQRSAYEDSIQNARARDDAALWLMHLDVDEYPFSPVDTERGFLRRYLAGLPPAVGQVVMRSLFFGGPSDLATRPDAPLPLQFGHRMPEAEAPSHRTKYMARVRSIDGASQADIVHRLRLVPGAQDVVPDADVLRVNHYWGHRLGKPFVSLRWDQGLRDLVA